MHSPDTAFLNTRTQRGFNLVEAAIVLGVIGLVIGGIWVAASSITHKNNVNRFVADIMTIVENTRGYGNASRWTGSAATTISVNDELLLMGIAPSNWKTGDSFLRDPYYGYKLYAEISTLNAFYTPRFKIEIEDDTMRMSRATCMAITTALYTALKNNNPVNTASPYSNVLRVKASTSDAMRELTSVAASFVSNNPCVQATGNLWLITLFVPY